MMSSLAGLCVGLSMALPGIGVEAAVSSPKPASTAPAVVVSIAPVHSLAAMVMEGVAMPHLLLSGGASPHGYALKPSDGRALARARLVIWIGPGLEQFLVKPLATLARRSQKLALIKTGGLIQRRARGGGLWETSDYGPRVGTQRHNGHDHDGHGDDFHVWLDPRNAIVMVGEIARVLSRIDSANGARYLANRRRAVSEITALDTALEARLDPIRRIPYFVYHDAYSYFEGRYGLKSLGAVVVGPDRRPGIKRLRAIRARLQGAPMACIFTEPQFPPALANSIVKGTGAGVGVLDPVGAGLVPGAGLYSVLLNALADGLIACLSSRRLSP